MKNNAKRALIGMITQAAARLLMAVSMFHAKYRKKYIKIPTKRGMMIKKKIPAERGSFFVLLPIIMAVHTTEPKKSKTLPGPRYSVALGWYLWRKEHIRTGPGVNVTVYRART